MDHDENSYLVILFALCITALIWFHFALREPREEKARRLEEEARRRQERQEEFQRQKTEIDRRRADLLKRVIPRDVSRDMHNYLRVGRFVGEDHSPLAYVGYKAGKSGLEAWDRRRRLEVCFAINIPEFLGEKYQRWGAPVTKRRFEAMRSHLLMLADYRRNRPNYLFAIADWEADAKWFADAYVEFAGQLGRFGYPG